MGCNNSHLRPLFRRCRRRSKKDDASGTPKRQQEVVADSNHVESSGDVLHGFQFLGSSMRQVPVQSDQPACVPLLAQSERSHSQIDFFKMLDDKIQEGPDYDSDEEKIETELLIKRNMEVWKKTIGNSSAWKTPEKSYSVSRIGNNCSKSNRCQWDDEGDGG